MNALFHKSLQRLTMLLFLVASSFAQAEDIDIFTGGTGATGGLPNILIVLDNTSNWARQSQQWPGGLAQGQSEVRAIKNALAGLTDQINVGLMEFTTQGNANQDGAFIRFALQELNATSQLALNAHLDTIFGDINGSTEKRNSNTSYGNLMYDVYNYLTGSEQSMSGGGTPASHADPSGYQTQFSQFMSPLVDEDLCTQTYLIFIGNPNNNGPATDNTTNSAVLTALYNEVGATPARLAGQGSGTPLPIPLFTTTSETVYISVTEPDDPDHVDYSSACYNTNNNGASACTADENSDGGLCFGLENCSCSTTPNRNQGCSGQRRQLSVGFTEELTEVTPTGENDTSSGKDWNFDDWAKFFYSHGVPINYTDADGVQQTHRIPLITYTIDVFNAQQNADHTGLMLSGANVGGGRYFAARNEESIQDAIESIISNILSVNSTFAAVALPLSATNRAQNENQVFIGMFRPDQVAAPRWFGNLKRYQVGLFDGVVKLADAQVPPKEAVNELTNFAAECAESFWSTDSVNYWEDKGVIPTPKSQCVGNLTPWNDLPDGPFVEKGGAAQRARNITRISASDDGRTVYTVNGTGDLTSFNNDFAGDVGGTDIVRYIRGFDASDNHRMDIHGDVIHSRPLPINYGGDEGSVIFYGANDALFRAISAETGDELWSLVAPEHFGKLQRLYNNTPLVAFPNQDPADNPEPKDYFFDGSAGQLVIYDDLNLVELAYIFPTMRRGGRMVYALNVTDPDAPDLLWRVGCTTVDDLSCTAGFSDLGQTWSLPQAAYVGGYTEEVPNPEGGDPLIQPAPIVMFGGGYDACEDTDNKVTGCIADDAKGRGIYILDAKTGAMIKHFVTDGSVAADIKVVDSNYDGLVDYAYTVDLSGNVWRVNFVNPANNNALAPVDWTLNKIAYTAEASDPRKLFNVPSALPYKDTVYLAFGSGNRERPLDSNYPYVDDVIDRFYVFLDYPKASSQLAVNLDDTQLNNFSESTDCSTAGVLPTFGDDGEPTGQRGWFMNLTGQGEQVVTTSAIAAGSVFFSTYKPGGAVAGLCSRPLGINTAYRVNLFTASGMIGSTGICEGDRSVEIPGGGMPISPVIGTVTPTPNDPDAPAPEPVTFCIGCEGLEPVELSPVIQQTRSRVFWSIDADR
ncbi:pilus assembly protein [Nitrincola sp. MINF-07-Sa-05]|uniref:pilus assembly protein n=1 Tax=Nitrincola salilacus TaxID=3400273 RepID=UPI0039181235